MKKTVAERVIVALDFPAAAPALTLVGRTAGVVGFYKVGLELFSAAGPDLVRRLKVAGHKVFLDLKFFDIPATVAAASRQAVRLGVDMFNLHLLAGDACLRAARDACDEEAARLGRPAPAVLGVTVLTSSTGAEWRALGLDLPVAGLVEALAGRAAAAGLDGVVASPLEAAALKRRFGRAFLVVTPGVRPGAAHDDQARVLTPAAALAAGSDYLVIGRPITAAPDPARACADIVAAAARPAP